VAVTSATNDEDKYTLEYYTSGERAQDEPPFKYRTFYLDDALAEAWRVAESGGEVLAITRRGQSAFDEGELTQALERISELDGAKSAGDERKRAARVLEESVKGETEA
jgi:hypothetical protein